MRNKESTLPGLIATSETASEAACSGNQPLQEPAEDCG